MTAASPQIDEQYDDRAPHAASEPGLLLKERLRRAIATLDDDATRAESERLRALLDVARAQNMFGGPK